MLMVSAYTEIFQLFYLS